MTMKTPHTSIEQAAMASMNDGAIVGDADGRVLVFNQAAARMLHIAADQALGRPLGDLFASLSPRGRLTIADAVKRLYGNPHAYGADGQSGEMVLMMDRDGRFIQARLAPMLTDEGVFLGCVTVLRDVTREVHAEQDRSDFISNVSQELRLPLAAIKGYCDLLLHDAADQLDGEQKRFLHIIKENVDHLVALVNDLLDISRMEGYRLDLDVRRVSLNTLAQEVAEIVAARYASKGVRLLVEEKQDDLVVLGDPARLRQVVMNLLDNALRYTPRDGQVTLALSSSDGNVRVDVSDTGGGMAPDDRARIFQHFYRPSTLLTRGDSTGLELPVTKMLVEMHGGRMWVDSELGRGTTFTFILPRVVEEKPQPAPEIPQSGRGRTVLVVEDDEDITRLITLQLKQEGFEVLSTAYGEEAVALAQSHPVDLITLDMMLPDISGMEVLHRIKSHPKTADIPVIIVSVLLPEQTEDAHQRADDYIVKPFAFEKLMESVRRTLAATRETREAGVAGGG